MRSSMRGLVVAVLAVLCLATLANASVITLTYASAGRFNDYAGYSASGAFEYNVPADQKYLVLIYDLSSVVADLATGNTLVSAKLFYRHNSGATLDTLYVAQAAADTSTITLSNYSTWLTQLGGDATTLTGTNICNNTDDGTTGIKSVDVTAIVQSWLGGAANWGVNIGSSSSSDELIGGSNPFIPYIEVTTASPEPATMGLLAIGGIATLLRRRKA
jgi:hypothetical protein